MFALIINDTVSQYPYTIQQLRSDNPNTSFPSQMTEEQLNQFNVYNISQVGQPSVDYTKNVTESTPQKINGAWTQVWTVSDATEEEITQRTTDKGNEIRSQRDALLTACDYTQLPDVPLTNKSDWATYREQLRQIPEQSGFPWNITWPTSP